MRERSSPEADVAGVVRGVLHLPVRPHGLGGAGGGERRVRNVEGGLGGGRSIPVAALRVNTSRFDLDDGGDVGVPLRAGQVVGRVEHRHCAVFEAVAALSWL